MVISSLFDSFDWIASRRAALAVPFGRTTSGSTSVWQTTPTGRGLLSVAPQLSASRFGGLLGLFTAGVDIRDANNDVNTTDVHARIYFADHRLSMMS
jgi:hypothetical protein